MKRGLPPLVAFKHLVDNFPDRYHWEGALESSVRKVMEMGEEEMLSLIPDRSGFLFVGCPNCGMGCQERQLHWSVEDPDHVYCIYCGMTFPNERYPETGVLKVVNPRGEVQEYPYWEDENGYRYFFRAKAWYAAREYFAMMAGNLALLYHLTKSIVYAWRSALIIDKFATVYPGYCVTIDRPFQQKELLERDEPPYPIYGGRWSRWGPFRDIPADLALAYELIRNSGVFERLSKERGVDVKKRIEEMFRASVEFIRAYPVYLGNVSPYYLKGMVIVGRVIGEPEYIHDAVDRVKRLSRHFFFDGVWREGALGYHKLTVDGLRRVVELLKGYSDPPGYVCPRDGEHFENLDLARELPILRRAEEVTRAFCYPDGTPVTIHDTPWSKPRKGWRTLSLRSLGTRASKPMLFAGVGHAWLGMGEGRDQVQVHLHFSGGHGHQHLDNLMLILYAKGHELISDIGYTHTKYRQWSVSTLSHNTVMVNGLEQNRGRSWEGRGEPSDGDLLLFQSENPYVQAVEARGEKAYPGIVDEYRRLLVLVRVSEGDAYVLDIFKVSGGERHEWALQGDASHGGSIETSLETRYYGPNLLPAGVKVVLPKNESDHGSAEGHNIAYAFIRNVRRGEPRGYWSAVFRTGGEEPACLRVHSLAEDGTEVFFGEAPSIRPAGENDAMLDDYTMPILVARRSGPRLSSVFLSVLEPYRGSPFIKSVERLSVKGSGIALKISHSDAVDYLIVGSDDSTFVEVAEEGLKLQGRLGFVRVEGGRARAMYLVGGTLLEGKGHSLKAAGPLRGIIKSVGRSGDLNGYFEVDCKVPKDFKGATVIVEHPDGTTHGYKIRKVLESEKGSRIEVEGEPGFEIEGNITRFTYYPQHEVEGENSFYIANSAYILLDESGKKPIKSLSAH
ncbi:MAG: Heparinase II/III-like protein [Candidatus Bathyarchaeota archaeon B26-2]|nr:MAG: Heparinase II/III-like protein [Candidatus Bathyarchaeota archaeon B26-2]